MLYCLYVVWWCVAAAAVAVAFLFYHHNFPFSTSQCSPVFSSFLEKLDGYIKCDGIAHITNSHTNTQRELSMLLVFLFISHFSQQFYCIKAVAHTFRLFNIYPHCQFFYLLHEFVVVVSTFLQFFSVCVCVVWPYKYIEICIFIRLLIEHETQEMIPHSQQRCCDACSLSYHFHLIMYAMHIHT